MDIHYLTSHVASKFAANKIPPTKDRSLLSQMIYYGKQVYLKEGYASIYGCKKWVIPMNKSNGWLIMKCTCGNILSKNNCFTIQTLLWPKDYRSAPFSKFYLEIDNESPGRVGVWMGWQIIRSYMDRYPNTEISALLNLPAQTLFSKSNYKPKR